MLLLISHESGDPSWFFALQRKLNTSFFKLDNLVMHSGILSKQLPLSLILSSFVKLAIEFGKELNLLYSRFRYIFKLVNDFLTTFLTTFNDF